jgi:predicted O-methyltransferase YrrM
VIVTDAVRAYLAELRNEPDPVLREMEEHGARDGVPIVVPETGALLHVLALAAGAERIVEVGTAIGVSTLYLARALTANGKITTFEIDEARHAAARDYLTRAGVIDKVDLRLQDARAGLAELDGPFDMAFIDGVKMQYDDYLDALTPLLRPRGVLAIDNVLMGGTVAENRGEGHWSQEHVEMMRALNARVLGAQEYTGALTPVGDGLLVAVRQ